MARPLITFPKVRWGIPLVLPHVLLSIGLLVFAAISERPAPHVTVLDGPDIASVPGASIVGLSHAVRRG